MKNHESIGKVWVVVDDNGTVGVFQAEDDAETFYDKLQNPYKQMTEENIWVNIDYED